MWKGIDRDIPNLTSNGIEFGYSCFSCIRSLQSSSGHSLLIIIRFKWSRVGNQESELSSPLGQ